MPMCVKPFRALASKRIEKVSIERTFAEIGLKTIVGAAAFEKFDTNKSGTLDKQELVRVLRYAHKWFTEEQAAALVELVVHKGTERRLGPISACIMGCINPEYKKALKTSNAEKKDIRFEEYMTIMDSTMPFDMFIEQVVAVAESEGNLATALLMRQVREKRKRAISTPGLQECVSCCLAKV